MDVQLAGWTVGVTADRRAEEQIELLARRGAQVVHAPTIRTEPLRMDDGVAQATESLVADPPDIVVLTTGVGTRAWFDAADALGLSEPLVDALRRATTVVRGPKAAGAARTAGLEVAWQAPGSTSAEVVSHLASSGVAGRTVAVQLDGRPRPVLAEAIAGLGARVVAVPVYRWHGPADGAPVSKLIDAVCGQRIDAVTFTSAPALTNLLAMADERGRQRQLIDALSSDVAMVSIGEVCTAAAHEAGIAAAVQPRRQRLGAMVLALAEFAARVDDDAAVEVGGRRVVVRAASVNVDGTSVELAPLERALLLALLERPGVVTKEHLAARAWPEHIDTQAHAVEVAIGRLRRRVEGLLAIQAVPKRGYLLTPV